MVSRGVERPIEPESRNNAQEAMGEREWERWNNDTARELCG
jgi:hypothetical protein